MNRHFWKHSMACRTLYNTLQRAIITGSEDDVTSLLACESIDDIHRRLCEELPVEQATRCVTCEQLFTLAQPDTDMMRLLLRHGAFPPPNICASRYSRCDKPLTPLKLAIDSGSIDDIRTLLNNGADVNAHPTVCFKNAARFDYDCRVCDSPLMAAVRRRNIDMIRLLVLYGADVSAEIAATTVGQSSKTALLLAAGTGSEQVVTELVACGADVNQTLASRGETVMHRYRYDDNMVNVLVCLGADPNVTAENGESVFQLVLNRCNIHHGMRNSNIVLSSLRRLLPNTCDLDSQLHQSRAVRWLHPDAAIFVLQHGARIDYSHTFLTDSIYTHRPHNSAFIEFLRAADTNFSGVRNRLASCADRKKRDEFELLNDMIAQPLTLQTLCVIGVRRCLRSKSDVRMLARIDALPVPTAIRRRLKLLYW